jgi:hypothetical protein
MLLLNSKDKMEDEKGKERKTQIDVIIRCLRSVGDPGNTTNWLQHDRCATFGVTRALPSDSLRSRNRQFGLLPVKSTVNPFDVRVRITRGRNSAKFYSYR